MANPGRRRVTIVLVVGALAVSALGVVAVRADPAPDLPPIAADELLSSAVAALAHPFTISGDVRTRFDLGIPQIPAAVGGGTGGGVMGALALVTGDQRYKVWHSPDGIRIAHLLPFAEQDIYVSTSDAWFWDSSDQSAVHVGVPGLSIFDAAPSAPVVHEADVISSARQALQRLAPYADVSVDTATTVAGRSAYTLVLTPTSPLTLIGRLALAIDAETRLPLRFQVFARGADGAAIEAGFTSVSFDAIDPSMFAFTPPPGTTVRQAADVIADARTSTGTSPDGTPSMPDVVDFGSGFDVRVAVELDSPLPDAAAQLLPYAGPLLSAITVEHAGHAWLLVGPVSVTTLEGDATTLP